MWVYLLFTCTIKKINLWVYIVAWVMILNLSTVHLALTLGLRNHAVLCDKDSISTILIDDKGHLISNNK